MRHLLLCLTLLVGALVSACGGAGVDTPREGRATFALHVSPESFAPGGSGQFDLRITAEGSLTRVEIVASGTSDLKALYYTLDYDADSYSPATAEASGKLSPDGELLQLAILDAPGVVTHGQVLGNWPDHSGFSGDGVLASVVFESAPLRKVALAPLDLSSQAQLSYDTGTQALEWRYASRGDYDQNSLVTIADLTPLGANLGASGPFPYATALSVVDGDSNGLITIADITPIGASIGKLVEGYRIYSSSTPGVDYPATPEAANGPGAVLQGSISFALATGAVTERKQFQVTLPSPASTEFFWVRPYDGTDEGIASTLAAATGTALAPTAVFIPSPSSGPAPLFVNFDASASSDADGVITHFEWDWDGDSVYDEDFGVGMLAAHTFASEGTFNVRLRVTDNDGYSDAASFTIVVGPTSNTPPTALLVATPSLGTAPLDVSLDASGSTDVEGPLAEYAFDFDGDGIFDQVGGSAVVNHAYTTPGSYLAEVKVTDSGGVSASDFENIQVNSAAFWHVTGLVEGADVITLSNGIAVVDGKPAVAWINDTSHALCYMAASDPLATAWEPLSIADGGGTVGLSATDGDQVALLEIAGAPAIAYYRDSDLYFTRASDLAGTIWGTPPPLLLATGFSAQGPHMSMAMVAGQPAIAYYSFDGNMLHYIRADSGDGTSWLNPDAVVGFGEHTSLVELNGRPAVSYSDPATQVLWFAYSSDVNGATGTWTANQITTEIPAGVNGTTLVISDSLPAVAWGDFPAGLRYTRATDGTYASWSTPISPNGTDPAFNGSHPSMVLWNGKPAISYARSGTGALQFVNAADSTGSVWNPPQNVDVGTPPANPGSYSHLVVVNNNPAISYIDDTTKDLKFAIFY